MNKFPTGNKDVDREILSKLPDEDVLKLLKNKVCDEGFFQRRINTNYPELKIEVYRSYKQAYLEIVYYISKMKDIKYNYVRNGKNPKDQYREVKDKISVLKKYVEILQSKRV